MVCKTKNKKICQKLWIFLIYKKFIQQIWKKILYSATKTGLDAAKTASKKVVHKTDEATGELIGNKIDEKVVKPKPMS